MRDHRFRGGACGTPQPVLDPARLLPFLQAHEGDSAFARRHAKLNAAIVELVEDFSLVAFGTLDISDKTSVARALKSIDVFPDADAVGGLGWHVILPSISP